MTRSSAFYLWFFCFTVSAAVAQDRKAPSNNLVSAETWQLCQDWLKVCEQHERDRDQPDPREHATLKKLIARPDADYCFLRFIDKPHTIAEGYWLAIDQLGRLNTQRTFDIVVPRLKADDMFVREAAIRIVDAFKQRDVVPLLLDVLEKDPELQVRHHAAQRLSAHCDARAEPAFLQAVRKGEKWVAVAAADGLAEMNSQAGIEPCLQLLKHDLIDEDREVLISSLKNYTNKAVVEAVLAEYERAAKRDDVGGRIIQRRATWVMRTYFVATGKLSGPQPDDYVEQWQLWWKQVEPLLTDDLKLKNPVVAKIPKEYADEDFGSNPGGLELKIAVDEPIYRVRDPIRLDLHLVNHSDKPYRVVLPRPPSGWMPTMAYGIVLKRGAETLLNIEPSALYQGSYSGPPPFETITPKQSFHSTVCLQYFLEWQIKKPLPEGDYEFQLTFDSAKFAAIRPKGVELVHAWKAEPVKFKIQGAARTDPQEVLELIAKKSGLPFLKTDLKSETYERREHARQALLQYGDSRLDPSIPLPHDVRNR